MENHPPSVDKVSPGSSPPIFTTDMIVLLVNRLLDTVERLYLDSRVIMTFISL